MDDSQLKVLLFAGSFEVRGSSAYTIRLAENLGNYGISATIVCPDAHLIEEGKRTELSIQEYPRLRFPLLRRFVMGAVKKDFSTDVPDLIHIQSRKVLALGSRLARSLACPYVVTIHDFFPPQERIRFDRFRGRHVIAVSQAVKSELISRTRLPDENVVVIQSGVEAASGKNTTPVFDPGHVPVVGTAGPLEAVKGHPFFLGAAQQVLATGTNVEFLIAGAGPEEENLRRMTRDLEISEHVTFVPNLLDFSQALAAMDIYCLPSLKQGLGTIMLEAMALGKPVIASGVGGVYSVVRDNETGLVVPPSNSGRLAECILALLNDPVRARVLGEAGRSLVQNEFSVEKMVHETADLYRVVLGDKEKEGKDKGKEITV